MSQLRQMTKKEVYNIIDDIPCDKVMVLTLKKNIGVSDRGKMLKKRSIKALIDKANIILLSEAKQIRRINLEGNFSIFSRQNILKTILIPHLE